MMGSGVLSTQQITPQHGPAQKSRPSIYSRSYTDSIPSHAVVQRGTSAARGAGRHSTCDSGTVAKGRRGAQTGGQGPACSCFRGPWWPQEASWCQAQRAKECETPLIPNPDAVARKSVGGFNESYANSW